MTKSIGSTLTKLDDYSWRMTGRDNAKLGIELMNSRTMDGPLHRLLMFKIGRSFVALTREQVNELLPLLNRFVETERLV